MRALTTGSPSWWRAASTRWGTKPSFALSAVPKVFIRRSPFPRNLVAYYLMVFDSILGFVYVLLTFFGFSIWENTGKLIILSNNCPPLRKSEIEYYAMLAKVGVHHYNGSKYSANSALLVCCLYVQVASRVLWFMILELRMQDFRYMRHN